MELYSVLKQIRFARSKKNFITSITKLVYELPYEFPDNFRPKKLENVRKISNLGGDISSQSRFAVSSPQKYTKLDTKVF